MKLNRLPQPQRIRYLGGSCLIARSCRIRLDPRADRAARVAARDLAAALPRKSRGSARLACDVHLTLDDPGPSEAYLLAVTRDAVEVMGHGLPGLFHGIQTLIQLIRDRGPRLPCLLIQDAPAFAHRGYYLDISRGKVPKPGTLMRLVDRLAALKINQLQLYVEHVFDFRFDPDIGAGCSPLTARDVRELDAYCRDRHIEFVPSLACFGHMGRILSLPQYRALAEVEWPARDWETATWRQRLRGATINPRARESKALLRNMLDEYLPLFSSPHFNLCGDETYDLGKGRNARHAAREGIENLYLDHIRFMRDVAAAHGKTLMFWGDVMLRHPHAIRKIPRDCTVLDWGYSPLTDFDKVGRFIQAGIEAYVCPSVRGYRVVFNDVEEARANIAGYARRGQALGAAGILTTDWGDMGHFNLPAASLHGMALGAAMGWNPGADEGRDFDRAFSLQVFGDRGGAAGRLYSAAGSTGIGEWPLLLQDWGGQPPAPGQAPRALRVRDKARAWSRQFAAMKPSCWTSADDLAQLAIACEALRLNAERILLEGARSRNSRHLAAFRRDLAAFTERNAAVWRRTNRPSGLDELTRAFRKAVRDTPSMER